MKGVIVGVALATLAIGLILIISGYITPISLGLLVTGAAAIATTASITGQSVQETMRNFFRENGEMISGVSSALLIIGILLCMSGIINPLSLGLVVAGATGLVATMALAEGKVSQMILKFFEGNVAAIIAISAAMLVLGILLCLSGIVNGLSIGLIVAGAVGLVTEAVINWSKIATIVETVLMTMAQMITAYSLVMGVILLCSGDIPHGLMFLAAGVAGLFVVGNYNIDGSDVADEINRELDKINTEAKSGVDEINNTLAGIEFQGFGGGSSSGHGATRSFGYSGSTTSTYNVPALAKGAVLPANRPFLAVVGDQKQGTNVEAPLSVIEQAVSNVLNKQSSAAATSTTIVMEIDGREIGRVVAPNIETEKRINGVSLISK